MFPHQQGFFPFAELQFSIGELLFKYLLSQCVREGGRKRMKECDRMKEGGGKEDEGVIRYERGGRREKTG
jgi:hypothetical protein